MLYHVIHIFTSKKVRSRKKAKKKKLLKKTEKKAQRTRTPGRWNKFGMKKIVKVHGHEQCNNQACSTAAY